MKSKRTVVLVLTAALIISAKPAFAKEANNNIVSNTAAVTDVSKGATTDKLADLSAKDKAKISQSEAKQTAKNILKDYFEVTIDDTKFQCNVNFNSNGFRGERNSTWNISWDIENENKQINYSVEVDGTTGTVLRVNRHEFDHKNSAPSISTITEEQAKEIGEAFLKKINPEEFKETTYVKDNNSLRYSGMDSYSFIYNRTINKVPFSGNNISVGVDGATGKVASYEFTWDKDVKAPDADKVIEQKQADDIFDKNTKIDLNYSSFFEKPNGAGDSKTKLIYSAAPSSPIIVDAVSGKALNWNGESVESVKTRNITDGQKEDIFKSAKTVQKLDKPISSERAEQVIKDKIKELCGDGYEVENVNYEDGLYGYRGKGVQVWNASFEKKDKSTNFGPPEGNISINALTEEVIRIDKFDFNENNKQDEKFQPKLTWEQAYDKAIQFIAKNCPEKIKEIKTEQINLTNESYMYRGDQSNRFIGFNFARLVNGVAFNNNGIPYNNDGINITFDAKTGEINSFGCMWQDKLDLPSAEKAVSSDEAKKTFLNTNKPQLTYMLFNKDNNGDKSNAKMQLVYSIANQYNLLNSVDALTGKALNFYGENVDDNIDGFKAKVKGSAVEKEASILASQGIIDTKDFKLDGGITRLQLVKVLVNAKGFNPYFKGMNDVSFTSGVAAKDSTEYKYVQLGIAYGIIEDSKSEFKGNELVTREELSKSLMKLLGYDKIAETKGLLSLPYSDGNVISADKTGYVSLAGGLKLIDADSEGKIRPKDTVTMTELIKAVYTALESLQK